VFVKLHNSCCQWFGKNLSNSETLVPPRGFASILFALILFWPLPAHVRRTTLFSPYVVQFLPGSFFPLRGLPRRGNRALATPRRWPIFKSVGTTTRSPFIPTPPTSLCHLRVHAGGLPAASAKTISPLRLAPSRCSPAQSSPLLFLPEGPPVDAAFPP